MFVARFVVLALVASACAASQSTAGSSPEFCRDVASKVGIDFQNPYGMVVADEEMGRIMQRNMGNGAAVGDYDADGDLDLYLVAQHGTSSRLYRNELVESGRATFTDVTESAGVSDTGLGRLAHLADLDGDSHLDLLVMNDTHPHSDDLPPSRIFRNEGDGTFTDVTEGSGFDPTGYLVGGTALSDFDGDGDLDIYISYWTRELNRSPVGAPVEGKWPGSNRYFENLGGFRFVDATDEVGLGGMKMDSFTAIPHDFDADGDPDLYVAVDHRSDRYYRNDDGVFTDVSPEARVGHRGNDMGIATGDIDGNGTFDLFVSNVFDPQQSYGVDPPGNTLLLTETSGEAGVVFVDEAADRGVLDTAWSWGAAFVDLDLDTDLDLYVVQGFDEFIDDDFVLEDATSSLLLNDGSGRFTAAPEAGCDLPGDQRALVPFDFDRDHDVDLLVTQVDLPPLLLENSAQGNAITVALEPSDAAAAGAVVEVQAGDTTMRRLVLCGGSYLAGTPLEAYFGLGEAQKATVTVTWANGHTKIYDEVPAGSLVTAERIDA